VNRRLQQRVLLWPAVTTVDRRGNEVTEADLTTEPIEVRAFVAEQGKDRDARRITLHTSEELPGASVVEWNGDRYDVKRSQYHHGPRQVRHWSSECTERVHGS